MKKMDFYHTSRNNLYLEYFKINVKHNVFIFYFKVYNWQERIPIYNTWPI